MEHRGEGDGHLGDVRLAGEDVAGHQAGGIAQIIVVDADGGYAAASADASVAADDRHLLQLDHIENQLRAGGDGVVRGDEDDIAVLAGILGHHEDVVGVGESELRAGAAHLFQVLADRPHLILGVDLRGAVEQSDLF